MKLIYQQMLSDVDVVFLVIKEKELMDFNEMAFVSIFNVIGKLCEKVPFSLHTL